MQLQRNYYNELFNSVEAKRNFAMAERDFGPMSKCNLTSVIEFTRSNKFAKENRHLTIL